MIEGWLVTWQQMPLPSAFLVAFSLHFTIYLAWDCGVAASYWLLREQFGAGRVLDEQPFFPAQLSNELLRGVANCSAISLVTLACLALANNALPPNGPALALQLGGLMLFYEVVFYFLHRFLHTKALRGIHGVHHKSVRTTPWSGLSVHPIEAIIIEAPILLFALLSHISVLTLVLFQVVLHYFSAVGHGNYDPFNRLSGLAWLKSYMRMHQLHHAHGNVNYSTFSPLMDRIFKTHGV